MIVGITGFAETGKDELAKSLALRANFDRIAFSDPLHEMAMVLNPIFILDDAGSAIDYRYITERFGYTEGKKKYSQYREYLQILGTDAVRNIIGEDTWIRVAERKIIAALEENRNLAITGVRYANECALIKAYGGTMVRVMREGYGPVNSHSSDTEVANLPVDHVILNNGTRQDLANAAQDLLNRLGAWSVEDEDFDVERAVWDILDSELWIIDEEEWVK
jgi:hypothetical protein